MNNDELRYDMCTYVNACTLKVLLSNIVFIGHIYIFYLIALAT